MIIGIAGEIGAGKDEVGKIIRFLDYWNKLEIDLKYCSVEADKLSYVYDFEIKKFAGKLKEIVANILGCDIHSLENINFKNRPLSEEWSRDIYYVETEDSSVLLETCYSKEEAMISLAHFAEYYIASDVHIRREHVVMTPRLMLQLMGTECGRGIIHQDIWCNSLMKEYDSNKEANWVITDVRFPNELEAIVRRGGVVIKVNRQSNQDNKKAHLSETALSNAEFNYTIDNSGSIEELVEKVKAVLEEIKKSK